VSRYLLRTVNVDGTSHGGFRWPLEVGAEAVAPDWNPAPVCGGGLHGFLDGEGDGSLASWDPSAHWLVLEVPEGAGLVDLAGKAKAERARVLHVGDRASATAEMGRLCPGRAIVGGTATAGNRGTATAGEGGTATAGEGGTATAGYNGTATAGNRGTATAGYNGTATAGYNGTATAGDGGTATAGEGGMLLISWWQERQRLAVAYVGEDGILPGVPYRLNSSGAFVRAEAP
jgi:hypothetical protein